MRDPGNEVDETILAQIVFSIHLSKCLFTKACVITAIFQFFIIHGKTMASYTQDQTDTNWSTTKIDIQIPGRVPDTHSYFPFLAQPSKGSTTHPIILLAGDSTSLECVNNVHRDIFVNYISHANEMEIPPEVISLTQGYWSQISLHTVVDLMLV